MSLILLICVLLILQGVVEFILLFLNQRKIITGLNHEPSQIADYFSEENWRQCSLYNIEKSKFAKITNFCGLIFLWLPCTFSFLSFWQNSILVVMLEFGDFQPNLFFYSNSTITLPDFRLVLPVQNRGKVWF